MKFKIAAIIGLAFLLASCGGSKKTQQGKRSSTEMRGNSSELGKHVRDLEELPNPEKLNIPHFENDIDKYIYMYKAVAMEEMGTYGIPASITLAQGILESRAGQSWLTQKSNNHFGIKCHEWQGAKVYHDDDLRQECFRKYKNPNYSFRDHSLFLSERRRYHKLFDLRIDNYKGWARGLKRAGYATDPAYPRKLINLIERYKLYKYDEEGIARLKSPHKKSNIHEEGYVETKKNKVEIKKPPSRKIYIVKKGDTLYSIARQFGLSVEALKKQNKLGGNTLSIGQELNVSEI